MGLMATTKETFVITLAAIGMAAFITVWWMMPKRARLENLRALWNWQHAALALGTAFAIWLILFSSFFTNPVVDADLAAALPAEAPRYPQPAGGVKTSAAWLIEHGGFNRGFGAGLARLSTKHTLAITNRGGAKASDVLALAREIRDGVEQAFGVRLVPEPVLVGLDLD